MRTGLFLVMLTAWFSGAFSQERENRGFPGERLELLRVWWLVDELQIDSEQAVLVFPVWSEHNRQRRELRDRRERVGAQVMELLQTKAGEDGDVDAALSDHIRQLREIEIEASGLSGRFHDQMGQVLSLRQQARMLLFEDRFRRDLKGLVREMRNFRSARELGPWHGDRARDRAGKPGIPGEKPSRSRGQWR